MIAGAARDCGVATAVTTLGLTFDAAALGKSGPAGWVDFWDVKRFPGKRGLPLRATQALAIALLADGVPASDISQALAQETEIERALKKLDQIKSQIVWWREPANALAGLRDGAVVMVAADAASVWDTAEDGKPNDLRVVSKDALSAFELWGIPRDSLNPDRAYELLRFMLRPERQAATAATWPRQPTLKAALALLPADAPAFARSAVQGVWIDGAKLARDNPDLQARFREWVGPPKTDEAKTE
jgi:putative spermidine/putrescine transport system substrate-binding protein